MRLCPKYTRAKEEGRQGSGSLISTFLMRCCRPRELVSAASGDELFRVLKTLLENIHGSSTSLWRSLRSMSFSSISFLTMTPVLFNKALVSSCWSALRTIFSLSRSRSARSLSLPSHSCRMTPVACSNEAFMSSCNLAQRHGGTIWLCPIACMLL